MLIGVSLDSNVWNFLFERRVDLSVELPLSEFRLSITREVELEIAAIPPEKSDLKAFIEHTIANCCVETDWLFGFAESNPPAGVQRVAGFDQGRWLSKAEADFLATHPSSSSSKRLRPSGLHPNEADAMLAARSTHSVVLTLDEKPGPLRDAHARGQRVVFLNNFDPTKTSLRALIWRALQCPPEEDVGST